MAKKKRKTIPDRKDENCRYVARRKHFAEGPPMAASPALSNPKASPAANPVVDIRQAQRPPVVHTTVHALPTGLGSRSTRRRTTPEAGFALEVLGHAIEYLADEYAREAGSLSSIHSQDPRVEAMQLLMAANRQVYYACPLVPSLYDRFVGRFFGR
jgi:hypothetical protein